MLKNIIFDFGGVLYNIDFKRTASAFEKLGCNNFEALYSQHHADPFFIDFEKGLITPDNFYSALKELTSVDLSNDDIRMAWNALLINYRKKSLDFLIQLSQQYNLFLLSNTNQIHYDYFSAQLKKETPYPSLESFFKKAYFSHEIHLRKPDFNSYEFVLTDAGINAAETLFIDDTESNIPNAQSLGIKTHLLKKEERIEHLAFY